MERERKMTTSGEIEEQYMMYQKVNRKSKTCLTKT